MPEGKRTSIYSQMVSMALSPTNVKKYSVLNPKIRAKIISLNSLASNRDLKMKELEREDGQKLPLSPEYSK